MKRKLGLMLLLSRQKPTCLVDWTSTPTDLMIPQAMLDLRFTLVLHSMLALQAHRDHQVMLVLRVPMVAAT